MDGLGNVMVVSNVKYLAITFLVNVPTSALGPLSHQTTFVAIVLILQRGIGHAIRKFRSGKAEIGCTKD